jgi:ring-1,2-phenylacetyl-CoA epoxidase subunit PaaE
LPAGSRSTISNATDGVTPGSRARGFHPLAVASVTRQTRDAMVVAFRVPPHLRERFRFAPGQYLTLRSEFLGEDMRRSYSICSAPHDDALCIAIKRVDDGRFSRFAHETIVAGSTIEVAPPAGRFGEPLDPSRSRNYLAFAAGSGITPIVSILAATLATEPASTFTLVYGNRASSTTMFREELLDLKDRYLGRLTLLFIMSRERQDVELLGGRIDRAKCDALFNSLIDLARVATVFVCGPPEMTDAVTGALAAHHVPAARIKTELFAAAPRAPRPPSARADVESGVVRAYVVADGRRHEFGIERGKETVLQAGLRQGIDLPYSCTGGVCSTCRALLVEGEVDMDVHYALEDYEIKGGYVLTCQSYAVTDCIGIDLDAVSHA